MIDKFTDYLAIFLLWYKYALVSHFFSGEPCRCTLRISPTTGTRTRLRLSLARVARSLGPGRHHGPCWDDVKDPPQLSRMPSGESGESRKREPGWFMWFRDSQWLSILNSYPLVIHPSIINHHGELGDVIIGAALMELSLGDLMGRPSAPRSLLPTCRRTTRHALRKKF